MKLYQAALKEGVAINPGNEWSTDKAHSHSRLRLCFASPTHEQIREGRRNSRRGLPPRIRRAHAQRQCGAEEGLVAAPVVRGAFSAKQSRP
jgi:hypothetical protein